MNTEKMLRLHSLTVSGWTDEKDAPLLLVPGDAREGSALAPLCRTHGINLAVIDGLDWDRELSPWPLRVGRRRIEAGAEATLARLNAEVLPQLLREWSLDPRALWIMGYSLAGLFALYAGLTDRRFEAAASVSGSLWAPQFLSFARSAQVWPRRVYLSLGDGESRSRDPVFARVGENTEAFRQLMEQKGVRCVYEHNPGGHFNDPSGRMLRAVEWLAGEAERDCST